MSFRGGSEKRRSVFLAGPGSEFFDERTVLLQDEILSNKMGSPSKKSKRKRSVRNYYKKRGGWNMNFRKLSQCVKESWGMVLTITIFFILFLLLGLYAPEWQELTWRGWYSLTLVILMMIALVWELVSPPFVFLLVQSAVLLLYFTWEKGYAVCGNCVVPQDLCDMDTEDVESIAGLPECTWVSPNRALQGYCNPGLLTVAILFVVAKGIEQSSILRFFTKYVLRKPNYLIDAQARLLIPVVFLSAFMNNTPIVALLIPVVESWSLQCKLSAKQLLMPLSFAAIMGGTCSLIGTSPNVIIAGLVDENQSLDFEVGFFSVGALGFPTSMLGLIYIFIFSRFLLKKDDNNDSEVLQGLKEGGKGEGEEEEGEGEEAKEEVLVEEVDVTGGQVFCVPILVTEESAFVERTIAESGLNEIHERITIQKIFQEGEVEIEVSDSYEIGAGDVIHFSGPWDVVQMVFSLDGVVPDTLLITEVEGKRYSRCIVHVVLAKDSPLIGEKIGEADFPRHFNSAVVAISRQNLPVVVDDLEEVIMQAGDVLVLESTTDFMDDFGSSHYFALVTVKKAGSFTPRRVSLTMLLVVISAVIVITLSATGTLDLLAGSFCLTCFYLFLNVLTWEQAKGSINCDVLFIIAAAFALGNAMQDTCVAYAIATRLLSIFKYGGEMGVLIGLYFVVAMMTAVISNAGTVTLMFPIAINFALCTNEVAISQQAAVYVLMMAGSAAFSTPIGYQTNLMVMGPGKYTTVDFAKFGGPLTIICMFFASFLAYMIWPSECN